MIMFRLFLELVWVSSLVAAVFAAFACAWQRATNFFALAFFVIVALIIVKDREA